MWASINGNDASASSSSASSLFFGAPSATASAAPVLPPVQSFKFNFAAPDDGGEEQNEEMSNDDKANSSNAAAAAAGAPLVLQRPAVQHYLSPHAAAPTRDELELLTLHASSTFTVSSLDDAAAAAASTASSSSSAAAASSAPAPASLGAPVLRFLKRRSKPAATHAALAAMLEESDLLPAIYEGGFKVWECSVDLVLLMHRHMPSSSLFPDGLTGMRVAELGCGHALPGIYALQRGASYVALQDYNAEVVEDVLVENTWSNLRGGDAVMAATKAGQAAASSSSMSADSIPMASHADDAELNRRVGFFSGDWRDPALMDMMIAGGGGGLFDLILTSDTLYSSAYMQPLLSALDRLLSPTGRVLVAAKRYYFGIGGSTMEFSALATAATAAGASKWEVQVLDTIEDGRSNIREILIMRRTHKGDKTSNATNTAASHEASTNDCAAME